MGLKEAWTVPWEIEDRVGREEVFGTRIRVWFA